MAQCLPSIEHLSVAIHIFLFDITKEILLVLGKKFMPDMPIPQEARLLPDQLTLVI